MTSNSSVPATRNAEDALRDAAAWRLIDLLFECPRPGWAEDVEALGRECGDPKLQAAAQAAQVEASEGVHHSLFGPGGPVSPREVTYSNGVQLGYLLSELTAYYDAFAYRPKTIEPSDHLSVESGFMAYLAVKEAYALASGNQGDATVCADAAASFRADHLARMVEPIARALEVGGPPYLALAGQSLFERVGPAAKNPIPLTELAAEGDEDDVTCATV